MNEMDDRIKKRITLIALLIALIHLICPTLAIDGITLTLLLIALIPWLSPVFKSLQFPGGWKIEYQEIKDKMETIIAKETEPLDEISPSTFMIKAFSVNDEPTRLVIKALGNPKYTWRFVSGLMKETNLAADEVLKAINWLLENELVTELRIKDKRQWALTQDGRDLLAGILQAEDSITTT